MAPADMAKIVIQPDRGRTIDRAEALEIARNEASVAPGDGHARFPTPMIYTHVVNRGGRSVCSPLDGWWGCLYS
jgi:hypothetical protein